MIASRIHSGYPSKRPEAGLTSGREANIGDSCGWFRDGGSAQVTGGGGRTNDARFKTFRAGDFS